MSRLVPDAIKNAVMGADAKIQQLESVTRDVTTSDRITTDFGVKQTSTDDWLRVVNEDQIGPMLLEDTNGREKVGLRPPRI